MFARQENCGFNDGGFKMKNKLLIGLALLVSIAGLHRNLSAEDKNRPNVIVIVSDDQGWADIGYNNPNVYSPNLDKLAATGLTFARHYVMPQCTPTRVALMTGRYPGRFGNAALAANNNPVFPKGTPTMASLFQDAGYDTFICGKWHLGSIFEHGPNYFGFDHSYGSMAGAVGMYDHRYRKGKFENSWHRDLKPVENHENGVHATDLIAREAVRIVKAERENPFFLYIPFHSVHTPLDERGPFVDTPTQVDPKNPKRWLNEDKIKWFNDPQGIIQKESDHEKRLLLAAVYHLDSCIGEIVKALDDSGKRKNTLILFSSDNGPQVNWGGKAYPDDLKLTDFNQKLPFRGKKVDVWEGGIHVPAFANWPGTIEAGKFDQPTHIVDWFPTLAALIEAEPKKKVDFDGLNILPAMKGQARLPKRDLYWIWSTRINRWALQYDGWKIVKYGASEPKLEDWQLFHLEKDKAEKNNVAAENPEKVNELHQRFLSHRAKDKAKSPKPQKKKKKNVQEPS